MSENNRQLRAELARSEERLSERTNQRDQFELAMIASDNELTKIHTEFTAATQVHAGNLAKLALKLKQAEALIDLRDESLADQTSEFEDFRDGMSSIINERDCFVAAFHDLKKPLAGGTQILEYIAAGTMDPARRTQILSQIIDSNKSLIMGTDRLASAALELSLRTSQLDKSNKDLVTRTEELAGVNAELRNIMQQREDFVAALTHDLKNPLIGGTKILEYIVGGTVEAERHAEILLQVIESNKNMLMMIWNMLDVYKKDSGALVPVYELVDITALLKSALNEFSFGIKEKAISVIYELNGELPEVYTDRMLLRRVFANLVDNAVKFTPKSGKITVTAACENNRFIASITNSGHGLTDTQLKKIFERFWQTESGRKVGIGTGMGLFVSKQIIESMAGSLECLSTENSFTKFTVTLNTVQNLPHVECV